MRDIPGPTSFYFRNQEVHYHRISSRRSASHFSQQTIAPFATSGPKLNHQPSKKKQIPTSATFSQTLRPSPPRSNGVKWRFSEGGPPTERERNTFAPPPYCVAHFSCFFFPPFVIIAAAVVCPIRGDFSARQGNSGSRQSGVAVKLDFCVPCGLLPARPQVVIFGRNYIAAEFGRNWVISPLRGYA